MLLACEHREEVCPSVEVELRLGAAGAPPQVRVAERRGGRWAAGRGPSTAAGRQAHLDRKLLQVAAAIAASAAQQFTEGGEPHVLRRRPHQRVA